MGVRRKAIYVSELDPGRSIAAVEDDTGWFILTIAERRVTLSRLDFEAFAREMNFWAATPGYAPPAFVAPASSIETSYPAARNARHEE